MKSKKETDSKENIESISFNSLLSLFKLTKWHEIILIFIAFCSATIQGALLPALMLIMGSLTELVINYELILKCGGDFNQCRLKSETEYDSQMITERLKFDLTEQAFNRTLDPVENTRSEINLMVILGVVNLATGFLHAYIMISISKRLTEKLRKDFFKSLLRRDLKYFETSCSTNEASLILLKDFKIIEEGLGSKLNLTIKCLSQVLSGIIVGFIHSWKITLVILVCLPCISISLAIGMNFTYDNIKKADVYFNRASSIASQAINSIKTVSAFGLEKVLLLKFDKEIYEAETFTRKTGKFQGISLGIGYFMFKFMMVACFFMGTWQFLDGNIALKDLLASYFAAVTGVTGLSLFSSNLEAVKLALMTSANIMNMIESSYQSEIKGLLNYNFVFVFFPV